MSHMKFPAPRPLSCAIASAVSLGMTAPGAWAQALEEIVITAERRETVLQDTPISVVAFSAAELEMRGVETMEDLGVNTPNLDIKGSRGTGNVSPTYQIRGISGGGGATGERGVGFYLDGVFVPRQTGPYMQVLDVARIEVLRGPQGTLFGRNSLGGAIRVFTEQPAMIREGYAKVTAGNYGRQEISLMYNAPVSNNLAVRGQLAWLEQDGYVDRGPQELGSNENLVLRLRGAWDAGTGVRASFGVMHLDSESEGNPQDLATFDMAPVDPINGTSDVISFEGGYADWMSDFLEASGEPRLSNNDPRLVLDDYTMPGYCFLDDPDPDWDELCAQINESTYTQYDATVNWDISPTAGFTSVTGYSDFESSGITDWQLLGMERRPSAAESWTFYQEFQLNSMHFDGNLDLVTGLNFFHETAESPRNYLLQATGTSIFGTFGLPTTTPTNQNPNGNGWAGLARTGDSAVEQESDSWGLFLNGTWHFGDSVNLTAGLRFAHDSKDYTLTEFASDGYTPPSGNSTTVSASDEWEEVDWRTTLDYHVTENLMLYGTVSKAYRAGSFNSTTLGDGSLVLAGIPPEKVINKEVGLRSDWLDGRFRLNLTYFDMDYSDRQNAAAIVDPSSPTGFSIELTNQGDVYIDGVELEAQLAATDTLSFNASAGWVDTAISDVCVNNGIYLYPSPSEESYQAGARWDFDMDRGAGLTAGLNYAYVGPQQTHPGGVEAPSGCPAGGPFPPVPEWFLDSRYELPGYGLLNARITYTSPGERWIVSAFGNNLTDKEYGNFASRFGGGYWEGGPPAPINLKAPTRSALGITRGMPLNWGLSFQYNMGRGPGG